MDSTRVDDVKIAGAGTLGSGTFGRVTISGAGTVMGDITCASLRINGSGTAQGVVKADNAIVNGAGRFEKSLQAGELTVAGDATVAEGAGIGRVVVKGRLSVRGSLAAKDVDLRGELNVGGDCEAETLTGEGAFNIDGLLNAETVDVRVYGPSRVREIGGRTVAVREPNKLHALASIFTWFASKRLVVDAIEADDVFLEFVTAKVVRGSRVVIGQGCDIDLVEYAEDFRQESDGVVRASNKIG